MKAQFKKTQYGKERLVADLSSIAEPLMAYEDVCDMLTDDQEDKLVDYIRAMAEMSYSSMSVRYPYWREYDEAHDAYVPADSTDFREKAVIADTRAVADTVLTYLMSATTGRNPMFQLEPVNQSSRAPAMILERILHEHMRRSSGEFAMAQMFMDSIRYGFAPTKIVWDAKNNRNKIINFDPRMCFPDPRVGWGDWDKMQFIVFTNYSSFSALESSGMYPKLASYPGLRYSASNAVQARGWRSHTWNKDAGKGLSIDPTTITDSYGVGTFFSLGPARVVDEAWIRLSGTEVNLPGIKELYLVITILDEQHIISMRLSPYGQQFPVVFGALHQDKHKTHGQALYDLIMPMHNIATYLMRSRIDNITAALNNLIFIDPTRASVSDLIDRNAFGVVRTMPGVPPNEAVFIAQVPDVTKSHLEDIAILNERTKRVAAASDAQQGIQTDNGVRTATEIHQLTQMGSQRLGTLAKVLSASTIRPLVRIMIANIQDSFEAGGDNMRSMRINASNSDLYELEREGYVQDGVMEYDLMKDLRGDIDYYVIDGTLPIEANSNPETWLNAIQIMGQMGLNMEYDLGKVAERFLTALGVSNLEELKITKEQLAQQGMSPSQEMSMMQAMQGATVRPQEAIAKEREAGNLVPISEARRNGGRTPDQSSNRRMA